MKSDKTVSVCVYVAVRAVLFRELVEESDRGLRSVL